MEAVLAVSGQELQLFSSCQFQRVRLASVVLASLNIYPCQNFKLCRRQKNKLCLEALGDKKENLFFFFFLGSSRMGALEDGRGRLKQHSNMNDVLLPTVKKARRAGLHSAVNLGSICLKSWWSVTTLFLFMRETCPSDYLRYSYYCCYYYYLKVVAEKSKTRDHVTLK